MKAKRTVLITGATGLVGSLLTMKALRTGHSVRLLARRREKQSPEERIRRILNIFGFSGDQWRQLRSAIDIYEGNITEPQFGLSGGEWRRLADGLAGIYHAAAQTGFQNNQSAELTAVNIDGTRNILRLAELSRAHLHYISTAYVVGDTESRVMERELKGPRRWKNPYEETKFIAERHIHSRCQSNELRYTVFRPAILIGDSVRGRTIRFNNIYSFMKIAHYLSTRRKTPSAILEAKPEASLNILPVNFAIDAIWNIAQLPGCEGKVFHITNPSPPKFVELGSIFEKILGLRIEFIDRSVSGKVISKIRGRKIGTAFPHYSSYMFGEPEFDLANTRSLLRNYDVAFPDLNESYFRKILDYAVKHDWGKRQLSAAYQERERSPLRFTERYFEEFLVSKLNQQLIQNLKNLTAVVSVNIQDEKNSKWVLEINQGMLTTISKNSLKPECSYLTDAATFEEIVKGNYQPQQAFFDGRGDIEGNIEKGLQVVTVLSEFFRLYPFKPKDDHK